MDFTLKEVHDIYLNMMSVFATYCDKNGLKYFMAGGTLLGAVREGGFIPWDDDVDFAMPRPDYEKFMKTYDGELLVKSFQNDASFRFPYMKILHPKHRIIHVKDEALEVDADLVIAFDVYPIDGLGNDRKKAESHYKRVGSLRRLTYLNMTNDKSPNELKQFGLYLVRLLPTRLLMKMQINKMAQFDFEKSTYCTRWRMSKDKADIYHVCDLIPGINLAFESLSLPAPNAFDHILRLVYGDYKEPIRENQGLRHDAHLNLIQETFANTEA